MNTEGIIHALKSLSEIEQSKVLNEVDDCYKFINCKYQELKEQVQELLKENAEQKEKLSKWPKLIIDKTPFKIHIDDMDEELNTIDESKIIKVDPVMDRYSGM